MNILINIIAIQDSGGITVLHKLLDEIKDSNFKYLIICTQNENIEKIINKFNHCDNFKFFFIKSKNFLNRLYLENIVFLKLIKENNIDVVYNFSGSSQFFLNIPQVTKVHNLLFYCKNLDEIYFKKKIYFDWLKQIFFKRLVFHFLLTQSKYIEVQSIHVSEYIQDFINLSKKEVFLKSDIHFMEKEFLQSKEYRFNEKVNFLYIVGPHFEHIHKNFDDFVKAMILVKEKKINFEISITLTKEQLNNSNLWNKVLNENTNFLGYLSKEDLKKQFKDNTILISTSIIETIGLHVIEATQNGILAIVPDEYYCEKVYGNNICKYELFNIKSLISTIEKLFLLNNEKINDIILKNQKYLIINEKSKYTNIIDIFKKIEKEKNKK